MPAFVVLEHDHPWLHWDFMLEGNGVLRTWRLERWPAPGERIPAEALADHRLHYLDYEGPVSGNRGQVIRRARGTCEVREDHGVLRLTLHGDPLTGLAELRSLEGQAWTFELLNS